MMNHLNAQKGLGVPIQPAQSNDRIPSLSFLLVSPIHTIRDTEPTVYVVHHYRCTIVMNYPNIFFPVVRDTHGNKNPFCCDLCDGKGLYEHKKRKYTCAECNKGKAKRKRDWTKYNCPHGKQKCMCALCGGNALCKTPHCITQKIPKYDGHC